MAKVFEKIKNSFIKKTEQRPHVLQTPQASQVPKRGEAWTAGQIYELLLRIDQGYQPSAEETETLRSRRALYLIGFHLTALPDSIGQLVKLQTLYLSNTKLVALPDSIGQLVKLQRLDLSFTQLTTLPDSIGRLSNLQTLNLSKTQLTSLPDSIGQLVKLQRLDLSFTQLTTLPDSIGQLTSLQTLDLSPTDLTSLPDSIGQLSNLQALDLSFTLLTSLPDYMARLSRLEVLDLEGSAIEKLPDWLGRLPALRQLDLKGLTLPALPESLTRLGLPFVEKEFFFHDEKGINLYQTTLTQQDRSVFLESPSLIPSLYKDIQVPIRACRVLFLGDGGTGKSYTIRRFLEGGKKESKENPYLTRETPGVEIRDYRAEEGSEGFTVHFWDFGGQELLHAMHRCFLTEDSCYVVVVRTRDNKADERARYWLRNVTAFAPKSPILLYVNCWENDSGQRSIDERGLRQEFPKIADVVYCSATEAEEAEFRGRLMEPILHMVQASPGLTKLVPRTWVRVRETIEAESRKNNYLDQSRYHQICAEQKLQNDQAPDLLNYFNALGVCFSYHRDRETKQELLRYKLLAPVWLTNALYAIIEEGMSYKLPGQEGRISVAGVEDMLCNPAPKRVRGKEYRRPVEDILYRKQECPYILDVAVAFELCYRVNDQVLFFPALCGTNAPEAALTPPEGYPQKLSYQIRYQYLPNNVLHRLMIRCMRMRVPMECCWLRGMILEVWNGHRAMVRIRDDQNLGIEVYSTGERRPYELFWMLRKQIMEISQSMNLRAEEFILDGIDEFRLEAVVGAAKDDNYLYGKGGKRLGRELLGQVYEPAFTQSIRVEEGSIVIPISPREFHPRSSKDAGLRAALYKTYHGICPYCGNPISSLRDMEVDHIFPRAYKERPELEPYLRYLTHCGFDVEKPDYVENYFPTHKHCNVDKRNRVNEFSLPYWHDLAAWRAPRVLQIMEERKQLGLNANDPMPPDLTDAVQGLGALIHSFSD